MEKEYNTIEERLLRNSKYISYAPDVTREMNTSIFWSRRSCENNIVLMNSHQIEELNCRIYSTEKCGMNDIYNQSIKFFTGRELYGICVYDSEVRRLPGASSIVNTNADIYYDEDILTSIKVNTPVLINKITDDGRFFHIVKMDYEGWVRSDNIAICKSRDEWEKAINIQRMLVVTTPKLELEVTGQVLTMGTKLSIIESDCTSHDDYLRSTWGCFLVNVPARDENGEYVVRRVCIPDSDSVSEGFLDYTVENELRLAFRFLGNAYGWGGRYHSVDCSQLVQDVFSCFGILLPRDAGKQEEVPALHFCFGAGSNTERRLEILYKQPAGTQLFFKGHTMLYLGYVNSKCYVISSVGSIESPYNSLEGAFEIRSIVINNLNIKRTNGHTWIDELTRANIIR